jgi:hypothetical protein
MLSKNTVLTGIYFSCINLSVSTDSLSLKVLVSKEFKCSTKQVKHETENKQKATKIQKFRHLVISIEIIEHHLKNKNLNILCFNCVTAC